MKPFASSILKLSLCVIALIITFYIYQVYNEIPTQETTIYHSVIGKASTYKGGAIILEFNYGEQGNDSTLYRSTSIKLECIEILRKKFNTKEINYKDLSEALLVTDFNDSIKCFKEADFLINTYATTRYQENNWLFAHPVEPIRKLNRRPFIQDSLFYEDFVGLSYAKKRIAQRTDDFMGWYFGKDEAVWTVQNLWASKWEHIMETQSSLYKAIKTEVECHEKTLFPDWYSAFDVSKIKSKIALSDIDSLHSITINFGNRIANISELIPYPDKKTIHGITYDSPEKLAQIKNHGLEIYATFPEYESLQQTRNYVLSALITLFLTLTATIGWNLLCSFYKRMRKLNKIRKKVIFVHDKIYIKLNNYFIANVTVVFIILNSIIYFINPYEWSLIVYFAITILLIGFGISDGSRFLTYRLAKKKTMITHEIIKYMRHSYWLSVMFVILFSSILFVAMMHDKSLNENGLYFGCNYIGCILGFYFGSYWGQKRLVKKLIKTMWKNRHAASK